MELVGTMLTTEGRAQRGDRAAWNTLVSRYGERVVLALIADGVPPVQAREFAQEAWMRLMEASDRGGLKFLQLPGLAVRQAQFLARTEARKIGAARMPVGDVASESGEVAVSRELLAATCRELAKMPAQARAVFALLYGPPGHSPKEVAAQLGISTQRVRQIVCEIRKRLRTRLEL